MQTEKCCARQFCAKHKNPLHRNAAAGETANKKSQRLLPLWRWDELT